MIITLDGGLPTLNDYIKAERTNRYIAAKIKREATEAVAWQCKKIEPITEPAHYTFTWIVKDRRTDPDNISFACKFILDGLQLAKKLPNDSFKYVKSITHNFVIGSPQVLVRVEPE